MFETSFCIWVLLSIVIVNEKAGISLRISNFVFPTSYFVFVFTSYFELRTSHFLFRIYFYVCFLKLIYEAGKNIGITGKN
jgi:hypothetical protein